MRRIRFKQITIVSVVLMTVLLSTQVLLAESKPWLGVYLQDITKDLAEAFDLTVSKGVLINDIINDSPADKAGLKQGDIIISFDGRKLSDADMVVRLVNDSEVGDEITLVIVRDDGEEEYIVEIGEQRMPRFHRRIDREYKPLQIEIFQSASHNGIGVSLQSLAGDLGEYFGVEDGDGALITEVFEDTPAEKAGLKPGDVIIAVDDDEVDGPSDVSELVMEKEEGDQVKLTIVRDRKEQKFTVEVAEIDFPGKNIFHSRTHSLRGLHNLRNIDIPHMLWFDDEDDEIFDKKLNLKMEDFEKQLRKMEDKLKELEKKLD